MSTKSSKALITGGSGYLASNLINDKKFRSLFSEIRSLGRNPKPERIKDQINIDFQKINLIEANLELKIIRETDLVIHTAHLRNIDADKELLNNFKNKRVIFFSSAAVYGNSPEGKVLTVNDECDPISDYGLYKLELEDYIKENFEDYLILRISNPYGGENPGRNIYEIFKTSIAKDLPININAKGPEEIIRDFIKMEDFIKQVIKLVKEDATGTFNISSGIGSSLESMLEDLAKEQGKTLKDLEINYKGFKEGDIQHSILKPGS